MIKNFVRLLQVSILGVGLSGVAMAALTTANGTVPFSFGVSVEAADQGNLTGSTLFTGTGIAANLFSTGTGSFDDCPISPDCVAAGSAATFSPGAFTASGLVGGLITFGPGFRYSYMITTQSVPTFDTQVVNTTAVQVFTTGSFADTNDADGFEDADASLVLSITEACTVTGCSYSGAGSFSTPPAFQVVPEPATMALMGLSLVGLGVIRARRAKRQ